MHEEIVERDRVLLRHMLATIAYRGGKAIRHAPPGFGHFLAPGAMNTPATLLAHIGDLMEWAHRFCQGEEGSFRIAEPQEWDQEVARFYANLTAFDRYLESGAPLEPALERLFQAPLADALTHIGQLALLRRMAGDPVLGESYRMAAIQAGQVGPDQAPPGREFEKDKGAIWRAPST